MTEPKNTFSIGDYIIDFENIYQIFEQKSQKNYSGKEDQYFFYRSSKSDNKNQPIVCSTPIDNIAKSGLRHLITPQDVKAFYQKLEEKYDGTNLIDPKLIKEILYSNEPLKNLDILKQLYSEKNKTPDSFSRANKELTENILNHICDEVAFVSKKPVATVKTKILGVLSKI
jgi:RNA polymerase-interacting CarD/CdnL/TRCF family regulator